MNRIALLLRIPTILPTKINERIRLLRWLLPMVTAVLVAVYELGLAPWIHTEVSHRYHILIDILFYGSIGPFLAFLFLDILGRWLEEKETSDLQARVLAQAREQANISRKLSDEALQILFAVSVLLASLKLSLAELTPESSSALSDTERALDGAIQQLRNHLQN
jgi:signal transduction histidine kinase